MKLSAEERESFHKQGWLGPFPLIGEDERTDAYEQYLGNRQAFFWPTLEKNEVYSDKTKLHWFKSLHCYLPAFASIVSNPILVGVISSLIGEDVLAWGATVTLREPGQSHRWHGDIEHYKWAGITAFIGLKNTTPHSSLKVIPGSHHWNVLPQLYGEQSNEAVLEMARKYDPNAQVIDIPCRDGECFVFAGRLWHGSDNHTQDTRMGLIAQYAAPNENILIPPNYSAIINWDEKLKPPCLLVNGNNTHGKNIIKKLQSDE